MRVFYVPSLSFGPVIERAFFIPKVMPKNYIKHIDNGRKYYVRIKELRYYSARYNRRVFVPKGYKSDGATGAFDIESDAWWVHDKLCDEGYFDNGSPCNNWQASMILSDILQEEGRYFRAFYWFWFTWLLGCDKCKENGML